VSETSRGVRRYAAEGAVIVVGILIALGADALWSYRIDRVDERVALRQLDAEFESNAAQLDSVYDGHRRGLGAATTLLSAIRGTMTIPTDSVRTLVYLLDEAWTYNPKLAALESVTRSGRLGLIRDDSLRMELMGWPGVVDDLKEEEVFAAEYVHLQQFGAFSEVLNWGDIYAPESVRGDREIRLVGNENLESIVAYRIGWYEVILDEIALTETVLGRIRGLIATNLTGG